MTTPTGASVRPQPLVGPEWLRRAVPTGQVVVLQVDGDATCWHVAHLPGALPLDWHDELHHSVRRGPLPQADFEQLMQRKGIERDTHVVLYSREDPSFAAYAQWLLRYYGHERVSMLDGGLRAWTRSRGPVVDEPTQARLVGPYGSPGPDPSVRIGREELVTCYARPPGDTLLLDCRTEVEYAGGHLSPVDLGIEHHRVGGHVPGAVNLPSQELLTPEGTFQPRGQLEEMFTSRGLRPASDVVVYCRVAERSSLLWFALHEILQHPRVRHYDGGWAEYGSLVDVPVARDEPL